MAIYLKDVSKVAAEL